MPDLLASVLSGSWLSTDIFIDQLICVSFIYQFVVKRIGLCTVRFIGQFTNRLMASVLPVPCSMCCHVHWSECAAG